MGVGFAMGSGCAALISTVGASFGMRRRRTPCPGRSPRSVRGTLQASGYPSIISGVAITASVIGHGRPSSVVTRIISRKPVIRTLRLLVELLAKATNGTVRGELRAIIANYCHLTNGRGLGTNDMAHDALMRGSAPKGLGESTREEPAALADRYGLMIAGRLVYVRHGPVAKGHYGASYQGITNGTAQTRVRAVLPATGILLTTIA